MTTRNGRPGGAEVMLPGTFTAALRSGHSPTAARWLLGAFLLVGAAYVGLSEAIPFHDLLAVVIPAAAPLGTFLVVLAAIRAAPRATLPSWSVLGLAAVCGAAGQLSPLLRVHGSPAEQISYLFFLAVQLLLAASVLRVVHEREGDRKLEIILDGALVALAALVLVNQWAPGAGLANQQPGPPWPMRLSLVVAPAAAICAALFAIVLWSARRVAPGGAVAVALGGGVIALALTAEPLLMGQPPCCAPHQATGFAWVLGWGLVAVAGLLLARGGAERFHGTARQRGGGRLRQIAAPLVALAMGGVVIDAALRHSLRGATGIVVGVVGMLLSFRLAQLLYSTRHQSAQRRQLSQTRMLVEVSQALASTTDLDRTLELVTRWAQTLLGARAAGIELLDDEDQTLALRAAVGVPEDLLGLRYPVATSFTGMVVTTRAPRATVDPRHDPLIQPVSLSFLGSSPTVAAPLIFRERSLGVIWCAGSRPFDSTDMELLGALADQAAVAIENARLFQQVHSLSLTDPLTGLANRRSMERELDREFAAARRGRRLVAVMFDLNGFKSYNDRYGHLAGDQALRLFADALRGQTRAMNLAARYGGDEFFALLADAERAGGEIFAQRVCEDFPNAITAAGMPPITASAGLAAYEPGMSSAEDLVAAADRALYKSKVERGAAPTPDLSR